jgi:hypothetical protein
MGHAAQQLHRLARTCDDPPASDIPGQPSGGHVSHFILEVVDVHWRTFTVRRQTSSKLEDDLAVDDLPAQCQHLSGVPVLEA